MVSIIICSRDKNSLQAVSENVRQTIGVAHEIIAIDNSDGKYGICQAYNLGARQSQYGILCFMHEDLLFHTLGWGQRVASLLADATIGVLGVAGGRYQPKVPAGYWGTGPDYLCMNVLHSPPGGPSVLDLRNPVGEPLVEAVVLDGLWLCSRREVWEQHPFDEQTFPKFHFYDMDYCTAIFKHLRVCVVYDILIEHFSKGTLNSQWALAALDYQRKWAADLPLSIVLPSEVVRPLLDRQAAIDFINLLLELRLPTAIIRQQLGKLLAMGPVNREVLGLAKKVIQQCYFGK